MRVRRLRLNVRSAAWAVALVVASLSAPAHADPFDDAVAAYQREDYATAIRLFRDIAAEGDAAAQYNLGYMYANGMGVARDQAEALGWFRRSADLGDSDAQLAVGLAYLRLSPPSSAPSATRRGRTGP